MEFEKLRRWEMGRWSEFKVGTVCQEKERAGRVWSLRN